jgi:transcriptional regulator with XRE-family HTH domain
MSSSRYPFRNVKATMVSKGLTLEVVARRAKIPYTMASEILCGRRNDEKRLQRLRTIVEQMEEVPA